MEGASRRAPQDDEPEQSGQWRRRRVCCSCNASGWRWWLHAGGHEYLRRVIPPYQHDLATSNTLDRERFGITKPKECHALHGV